MDRSHWPSRPRSGVAAPSRRSRKASRRAELSRTARRRALARCAARPASVNELSRQEVGMKEPLIAVAAGSFCWRLRPEFADLVGVEGICLKEWLRAGKATVVKEGPHRIVYRVALDRVTFYVKHNLTPDHVSWIRQLLRPSKARREYESALKVAARGIPTAAPLAWGQRRGFLSDGESMLITRSLDETQPLSQFVNHVLPTLPPAREARLRQQLAVALGQFLARMHQAGIRHNDLHAGNLLIRLDGDELPSLFLIDL